MAAQGKRAESSRPGSIAPGALRVLQVTDSHLFADPKATLGGVRTLPSYNRALEAVVAGYWPLDLILFTGDLVHDGSLEGYQRIKRDFEELGVRTLVIPGNHDDPAVMRRVFAGGRAMWSAHAVLGAWQFIMLDSSLADSAGGEIGIQQLAMLERTLHEQTRRHALIGVHHPPVAVGSAWLDRIGLADAQALLSTLGRFPKVRALVCGHVHQELDTVRDGIRLLACPSTAVQFRPGSEAFALDERPAGFRVLLLYPDGTVETCTERLSSASPGLDRDLESYV